MCPPVRKWSSWMTERGERRVVFRFSGPITICLFTLITPILASESRHVASQFLGTSHVEYALVEDEKRGEVGWLG